MFAICHSSACVCVSQGGCDLLSYDIQATDPERVSIAIQTHSYAPACRSFAVPYQCRSFPRATAQITCCFRAYVLFLRFTSSCNFPARASLQFRAAGCHGTCAQSYQDTHDTPLQSESQARRWWWCSSRQCEHGSRRLGQLGHGTRRMGRLKLSSAHCAQLHAAH